MDSLTVSLSESPFNKDVTLLTVNGSMDNNTISEFDKSFQSALRENRFKLVVDLKNAHYISSAGWGLFVSEIKRIRFGNGDLVLAGMTPDVLDVFELLQFNSILKFFPDVETAVNKGFEGLPPGVGKNSKGRVKKTAAKAASPEPSPMASHETGPDPATAPEPALRSFRAPSWRRLLRDWRFWGLVLLAALAAYLATGAPAWQAGTLPHWASGGK